MHEDQEQPDAVDEPQAPTPVAAEPIVVQLPPVPTPRSRAYSEASWLRLVIVVWCFWLLGAWAMAWVSDTSVPRVRWMLFAGSFGLMIVWPTFRLSERGSAHDDEHHAIAPVLLDWLGMILVYQAVIWSLHLMAGWPLVRGLWLDAAVVAWSLLTALIVATVRHWPFSIARSIGMLLCIALVFAEPIAVWIANLNGHDGWSMRVSPIQALWELTEPPTRGSIAPWDQRTMMVGLVAIAGWLVLGCWAFGERMARSATLSRLA